MADTKQLYLNGKLVGDCSSTGDFEKDHAAAVAVLREKGLWKEPSLEQLMLHQAVSFATTASYLYSRDLAVVPRKGTSVAPFVVNSALALELYLKTLGQMHGRSMRGHDLLELFDRLPPNARSALLPNFPKSDWQCGIADLTAFRKALEDMRDAFVEWRYLYERRQTGPINLQPMIFIMKVLHEACRGHGKVTVESLQG